MKRAFTLIELLVVVAIMGLLGTAAVGGYRAMQRGMEERGAMQNANQFIRSAFQRSQIDRTLVAVYFWNETLQEESQNDNLIVVGKAVAVRRAGRLTAVSGNYLIDEFGDLRFSRLTLDEDDGTEKTVENSGDVFLYPMNGTTDGDKRSLIYQNTEKYTLRDTLVQSGEIGAEIETYAYVLSNNDKKEIQWKTGDAYGLEFAELQLPHGFVFGTGKCYSDRVSSPVYGMQVMRFKSGDIIGMSQMPVSMLRPGKDGSLEAQLVGRTDRPNKKLDS